jgi:hypothetical protein
VSVADKYTSTAITGTNGLLYRIKGQRGWTTATFPATITGSPGTEYEFAIGVENSSLVSVVDTYKMPCEPYPKKELLSATIATPSSVSVTVKSPDGTANANSTAYDATAGDVRGFKFQVTGQYQRDYGSAPTGVSSPNVLVCVANSTAVSSISIEGLTPTNFVPNNATKVAGTSNSSLAWNFPIIGSNWVSPEYIATVTFSGSAGVISGVGATEAGRNVDIDCYLYDYGLYRDSTYTGNIFWGIEDEARVDVAKDNYVSFTMHVN